MTAQPRPKKAIQQALGLAMAIVLSPIWIPFVALWLVFYVLASICLYLAIWALWLPRSKHILFVYSDSPIWHDYIDEHILPVIRDRTVVLNWSQRRSRSWRRSLAVAAFKHFGGWRDFNPMAIVFRPFHRAKVFRFLPAFREFKHGRPEKLLTMQQEFFEYSRARAMRPNA